jgi:hypothetical protein
VAEIGDIAEDMKRQLTNRLAKMDPLVLAFELAGILITIPPKIRERRLQILEENHAEIRKRKKRQAAVNKLNRLCKKKRLTTKEFAEVGRLCKVLGLDPVTGKPLEEKP